MTDDPKSTAQGTIPFTSVKAPSPALPKGGGAIRGIGETFSTNSVTGTGSFQVPIATSPGRGGFGPSLGLSYDSGAGNGPFGLGWQLSVPAVTRKTDKRIPEYDDIRASDVFQLAGFEDLVPSLDPTGHPVVVETLAYRAEHYQPRVEGAFARIEKRTSKLTYEASWRVTTRDHVTHVYGETAAARIVHPRHPELIFSWLIERSEDDRGNVIVYEYKAEDLAGVPKTSPESPRHKGHARFSHRYLKRIRYGNTTPGDADTCVFEVVFDYGEHHAEKPTPSAEPGMVWPSRPDPFSSYRAGFEIRTYRLCRRVLMFHRFAELGVEPTLVHATEFAYVESASLTRLAGVTHTGFRRPAGSTEGYTKASLPSLELTYSLPLLDRRVQTLDPSSSQGLGDGSSSRMQQWVDLDGEGLPGVLAQDGGAFSYKRNLGGGRLAPSRRLLAQPAMAATLQPQLMDLGSDGQLELVAFQRPVAGYHERRPETDGWGPFLPLASQPNIDWNDPNLRFIDLTGDGLDDILLVRDTNYLWFPSLGKRGFGPPRTFLRLTDDDCGPTAVFAEAQQTYFLADMTGDGLADIVRIRQGNVSYWPNLGHGKFGAKITMASSPWMAPEGLFDARRIRLADLDGSGTTDLVYFDDEGVRVWSNQAGNSWGPATRVGRFPNAELGSVSVLDLLGTGTACVVWSSTLPGTASQPVRFIDVLGSKKPHLLTAVKNNLGLETRVAYAPSTKFYLEDRAAGRPWVTRLPFPVHVVERVETYDAVSRVRFVSEYKYHHGHYDGDEREFRGFGMVEQWDTEAFSSYHGQGLFPDMPPSANNESPQPPVLTKTWFSTGAWSKRGAIGRQYKGEYYALDAEAPSLSETLRIEGLAAGERLTTHEEKQACRALRGQALRQEIYGLDGSAAASHPYSVTESRFAVRRVQPATPGAHGVFVVHPRESSTRHYERNPNDPRTVHALTLEVDAYGTVLRSAAVAYPRRTPHIEHPEQGVVAVTLTETDVANVVGTGDLYRLGVPLETRVYELHGAVPVADAVFPFEDFVALVEAADTAGPVSYELEPPSGVRKRLLERVRIRYYDSANLPAALPWGAADAQALVYESYQLALTPGLLALPALGGRITEPVLVEGGYVHTTPGDLDWWAPSGRALLTALDATRFYQPRSFVNPFGASTTVTYDAYELLVTGTEDALGNAVQVGSDYRTLAPELITDPNGNRTAAGFDALGRITKTAVMGKVGSSDGDTLEDPTMTITYSLERWKDEGKPNRTTTRARETHGPTNTRWQESYSYFDGSGREVMRKVNAEPGLAPQLDANGHPVLDVAGDLVLINASPRWVGTGRTVFDNKGNPIKKYEPFFSATHDYEDDEDLVQWGVTPILRYDPLGRLLRTDLPNGTHARVEFTPWKQTSFDENDTVSEVGNLWRAARQSSATPLLSAAEQRAATLTDAHAGTPAVTHFDVQGRAFLGIADNGGGEKYATRPRLDIEGNPLSITDARGNVAMAHLFGVAGQKIHQKSIDAGERWMIANVVGSPIRRWDERGHAVRMTYDLLQRPMHLFVQKDSDPELLAERTVYGEAVADAADLNLRGKVYQTYDAAGVVTNVSYDSKGNVLEASRRLATAYATQGDWDDLASLTDPADIIDAAASQLEAETFTTTTTYDALNRPTSLTAPDASEIKPTYNEAGLLEAVDARIRGAVSWTSFVDDIAYDAKGQRARIEYGNGTLTEYTYDALTFRLTRLKTQRTSDNTTLQDLVYTYDPVGNIVAIEDAAHKTVFFNNAVVDASSEYEYDAVYRLVNATGREHASAGTAPHDHNDVPLKTLPHANDAQAIRIYEEQYEYDAVGNLLKMLHYAGVSNVDSWTRGYDYPAAGPGSSNRLRATSQDSDDPDDPEDYSGLYTYDEHGNMTTMPHLDGIAWDFKDQMRSVDKGGGGDVYFTYDAGGSRVRKVWVHSGIVEERIYLGAYEIYRRHESASLHTERQTLHVMDDTRRIAMVETLTWEDGEAIEEPDSRQRFQLGNHLGSAMLEVDEGGAVISYEEYHPYGTTAYWSADSSIEVSTRRYRYTGKEKDEETGLYYHGARYYASWLGRWTAADPAGMVDGPNLYAYVRGNPVRLHDPSGMGGLEASDPADPLNPRNFVNFEQFEEAYGLTNGLGYDRAALRNDWNAAHPAAPKQAQAAPAEPGFWEKVDQSRGMRAERALATSLANIPNTLVAGYKFLAGRMGGHIEEGQALTEDGVHTTRAVDDIAKEALAETEAWRVKPPPGSESLSRAYDVILPFVVSELVPNGAPPGTPVALAETKTTVTAAGLGAGPGAGVGGPTQIAVGTPTRIVSGATVTPRGQPAMTGNVDLGPTLDRIASGGRFPHRNDGSIFQNRPLPGSTTRELPAQPDGYYQEFVHPTPGVPGPGPQRIVVGKGGEVYYTPDHYGTFIPLK